MKTSRVVRSAFRFAILPTAALLCSIAPAGAQAREGSFDRTLRVTGAVELSVQAGSGQVRVQPGAADSVHVVGRMRAGNSWLSGGDVEQRLRKIEQAPPIEQQGNTIRIGRFTGEDLARDISISYDVTVPPDTAVSARTGSGSIVVGSVRGAANVSAGSGSIQVDGAARLDAHTGSGSIHATAIGGAITADSGSGSITVAQTGAGEVSASTGSGSISLAGVNGAARVSSGSGSITLAGRPAGPWTIHASSGTITLTLPPDSAFDLDARTSSGSLSSAHPVTMSGTVERHRLEGKVRGGGTMVKVSTSSGSIRIK